MVLIMCLCRADSSVRQEKHVGPRPFTRLRVLQSLWAAFVGATPAPSPYNDAAWAGVVIVSGGLSVRVAPCPRTGRKGGAMKVLHVSVGDAADPVTSWCRWGGSDQDWYRLGLDPDGTPPRFRRRGRSMTREQRDGLHSEGWCWDGAAWRQR